MYMILNALNLRFVAVITACLQISVLGLGLRFQRASKYPGGCPDQFPFNGCLQLSDRAAYFDTRAEEIPCGMMTGTELGRVAESYPGYEKYDLIVVSSQFGAYDEVQRMPGTFWQDIRVLYVLFTDDKSMKSPLVNANLITNSQWHVHVLKELPYPTPARNCKAIKSLLPRLFPKAKWIFYLDSKYRLVQNPLILMEHLLPRMNGSDFAVFQKNIAKYEGAFRAERNRMIYLTYHSGVSDNRTKEADMITSQRNTYLSEGFINRIGHMFNTSADTAILVVRPTDHSTRFYCAWANEISIFSHREQLSLAYVEDRFGIVAHRFSMELAKCCIRSIGHLKNGTKAF
jgi:hypothetical protein